MIEVLQPGVFTTFQDLGRRGYENYGVPRSGAFDPFLASVANYLVGNSFSAALLEFALVGPSMKFESDTNFAVTAMGCTYLLNGKVVPSFCGINAPTGSELRFQNMGGWFGYLAVVGGFQTEEILGSASVYLAGHIGTRIAKGMKLKIRGGSGIARSIAPEDVLPTATEALPIVEALHTSRFPEVDHATIAQAKYEVSLQSDRMGIRLKGQLLNPPEVRRSTPVLPGTLQVPASGEPILLGPDGPTTGGYAQFAVMTRAGWTLLACSAPGTLVSFRWISKANANELQQQKDALFQTPGLWKTS